MSVYTSSIAPFLQKVIFDKVFLVQPKCCKIHLQTVTKFFRSASKVTGEKVSQFVEIESFICIHQLCRNAVFSYKHSPSLFYLKIGVDWSLRDFLLTIVSS